MPALNLASRPTTRLLRDRVRTFFRHLPGALAGGEEELHQMRVASRRLRVALPLLASRPRGRRVARALGTLRALTRAGGASRDLDVALGLLEPHLREAGPSRERVVLRGRLRAARTVSRRRLAEALLDTEIAELRRDLRAALARGGPSLPLASLRVRAERETRGSALLDAVSALGEAYDPDRLHHLRIQARKLRYAAELRARLAPAPAPAEAGPDAAALWKDLQERLGLVRDTHVLAVRLGAEAAAARRRSAGAVAAEAELLAGLFDAQSRDLHQALLRDGLRQLVERALEAGPACAGASDARRLREADE